MQDAIQITSLAPSEALSPFIESFWIIKNDSNVDQELVILPDGCIDLYFFHSEQYPFISSLVGLKTDPRIGLMPACSILLGVSLKLLAAEYLLNASVAEILNDWTTIANGFANIDESDLLCFDTFCKKLNLHFLSRLATPIDLRKRIMSEQIYKTKGITFVSEISLVSHWSSRQINRYFNKWLGLPMKTYCDVIRFHSSFESLKAGKLFPEEGSYDQSHFIKLIKKYSHLTPKKLAQNKNDRFIQLSSTE